MSLQITANIDDIAKLPRRLDQLAAWEKAILLEGLAAETESQTRRRLNEEKTSPDGTPWEQWSDRYAAKRRSGHSLLMGEGDLHDSIESVPVDDDSIAVGSNLIYAAIHDLGGTEDMAPAPAGIPQRQYLGWSDDNLDDLQNVVDDFIGDIVREAMQ